jgi:uroporphyrinogen decarboxylase
MDVRERFRRVAHRQAVDRVPAFEEEIREEVLARWYGEGLSREVTEGNYLDFFSIDKIEYLYLELDPRPGPLRAVSDFHRIEEGYRDDRPHFRRQAFWEEKARGYEKRTFPLGITGWRGFMLPLFSRDREWDSLQDVLLALYDYPELVKHSLALVAECYMETISLALRYIDFDFGLLSEPIASRSGPIISPWMFREFVLPFQRTMVDFFHDHGIEIVIFRSIANVQQLLPSVAESGVDGLWINQIDGVIDYLDLREAFPDLLLVGGIDAAVLLQDEASMAASLRRTVPALLARGRYLPCLDDRPRENTPYNNYLHYRRALREYCNA